MKEYPTIPSVEAAPDGLVDDGHLWLLEKIDGVHLRFQLQQSGLIRFGDRHSVYDDADDVPDPSQHAVRYVREHLDREALRNAVDDVEDVVFFGEVTSYQTIDYEWDRIPSFLGFDIWSADTETFRPPDAVHAIFDGIGLESVTVFERERRARDFDPESYTIPQSEWNDGPAEGVVIRDKRGQRAKLLHPDAGDADTPTPVDAPAEKLAAQYATRERLERLATQLEDNGRPVTFETHYERVLEDILREAHGRLSHGESTLEMSEFRAEVGALTRAFLDDRTAGS
ncbi:RNA ligase family protein [Natronolimnobius sp. AArcel1]|uniref:RNA ligase family protein n=1 Tax=Natronolimnobius sp. AArcel1 TaxID=1679093 RepID=UPI0013ED2DE2|nr:RNA ligase family protein [Natronolimnobius sp. AArcel1]NGM68547.1 RNA ligase family protein [Natronolimnobius sp. AArcel1]